MGSPALIIHVPHASTLIPADLRDQFVLDDADLDRELLLMTDHFVDELFALPPDEAVTVRHEVSRLVCDPERFEYDEDEEMAGIGMGVIYTRTHAGDPGKPLRRRLTAAERRALLDAYYRPHHTRLEKAVSNALEAHGRCLIIDAHSYPERPLPYEKLIHPEAPRWMHRPAICLGSDPSHTPLWLQAAAFDAFAAGFDPVVFNRPFPSAIVPLRFYRRDARVASVMVEVRRDLYMDETTGEKLPDFDMAADAIRAAMRSLPVAG